MLDQTTLSALTLAVDRDAGGDGSRIDLAALLAEITAFDRSAAMSFVELDHPRFTQAELDVFTRSGRRRLHDAHVHDASTTQHDASSTRAASTAAMSICRARRDPRARRADPAGAARRGPGPAVVRRERARARSRLRRRARVVRTAVHGGGCLFLAHDRARLRDPPRVARAGLGLPRRQAGDLPAVPAVLRRGRDPRVATTTTTTRARTSRSAVAVPRRARHARRRCSAPSWSRDGCRRGAGQRPQAAGRENVRQRERCRGG